jgi:hypothetical protein
LILGLQAAWGRLDRRVIVDCGRSLLQRAQALAVRQFYSLLERLGYRPVTRLTPPFVPPVAARLVTMLRAGEHERLRYTLSRLHPDSLRSTLEAMLDLLDEAESSSHWLERLWRWYQGNREILAATALIHGLLRHARICHGRGEKWAAEFRESLEEAERLLDQTLAKQPENADLLCLRLFTARGLRRELPEHWLRFRALLAVAPTHYRGHLCMLENLTARWCGSDQAMFRFARGRASQLPVGDPLRALPLLAHFEMRQQDAWRGDLAAVDPWFCRPEVSTEVIALWQELQAPLAGQGNAQADELLNFFAAALYLCSRPDLASEALTRMDGRCAVAPWNALGRREREKHNPGWVVDRVKAEIAAKSSANPQ